IQGERSSDPNAGLRQAAGFNPAGGNIGIIKDPLTPNARLVAATRPIPYAFPDNLVRSNGGKFLYAAYRGTAAVFAFDVDKMLAPIEGLGQGLVAVLQDLPIDGFDDGIDAQ